MGMGRPGESLMKKLSFICIGVALAASPLVFAQPERAPRTEPPKIEALPAKLPDKAVQDVLLALLAAIEADDYANFARAINDEFKASLTNKVFAEVVASLAPRLDKGYDITYMGELNKGGFKVTVWKLVFKDKGDDVLVTLSIKGGKVEEKVGGFYLN